MPVALALVAACQARAPTKGTRRPGPLDLAGLVPRDSMERARLVPRVISTPSVVVFWLAAADTLTTQDRADAYDDLRSYTAAVSAVLAANDIRLLATSADTVFVALPDQQRRMIVLSGLDYPFGYVLVDPGGPERILTGVYAEGELLDELRAYFDLEEDSVSARPRAVT
jgi:hypothetical protein